MVETTKKSEPWTPPSGLVRAVFAVRNALVSLTRRSMPGPLVALDHVFGVARTQMVYVAARLRIADHLAGGPMTAAELAKATGAPADALHRLLRALATEGIFEMRRDGRFGINAAGDSLRENAPGSLRNLALYIGAPSHMRVWGAFDEAIRSGKTGYEIALGTPVFDYFASHPDEGAIFDAAMTDGTRMDAVGIAQHPAFGGAARVCDLGGGRGVLLARILRTHPKLRGALLDAPAVCLGARVELEEQGVLERCAIVEGSFFEDVPKDCDVYILKDILHDWDDANARKIIAQVAGAMPPRAKLLVIEAVMVDDAAQFPVHLIDLQMMISTNGGRQRTVAELERLFRDAGLDPRGVWRTPTLYSVVEAGRR